MRKRAALMYQHACLMDHDLLFLRGADHEDAVLLFRITTAAELLPFLPNCKIKRASRLLLLPLARVSALFDKDVSSS